MSGDTLPGERPARSATVPRAGAGRARRPLAPAGLLRPQRRRPTRGSGCGTRASTPSCWAHLGEPDRAVDRAGQRARPPGPRRLRPPHDLLGRRPTPTPSSGAGRARSSHHPAADVRPRRRRARPPGRRRARRDSSPGPAAACAFLLRRAGSGPAAVVVIVHPWESGCDDSPRWDAWCPERLDLRPVEGRARANWSRRSRFDGTGHRSAAAASRWPPPGFNALVAFNAVELAVGHRRRTRRSPRPASSVAGSTTGGTPTRRTWADEVVVGPGADRPACARSTRCCRCWSATTTRRVDAAFADALDDRRRSAGRSGRPASTATSRRSTRRPTGGARPGPSSPTCSGWPRAPPDRAATPTTWPARLVAGRAPVGPGRVLASRHGRGPRRRAPVVGRARRRGADRGAARL